MRGLSIGEWLDGALGAERQQALSSVAVATIGLLRMALLGRMVGYVRARAASPDDVPELVASLACRELGPDVAARQVFAIAFSAALAELSGRLGLCAVRQWARDLMNPFVPGILGEMHRLAGSELAGADLVARMQEALGEDIAGYRYQLIWRRKRATSALTSILRMLVSRTDARSGLPREDAEACGRKLLMQMSRAATLEDYQELIFDHFACTAILDGASEPTDYDRLATNLVLGGGWRIRNREATPRSAYHRRLFMIAEHVHSGRRLEVLVKSREAFVVGRAYQWTARGTAVLAELGPMRDGQFDWPEAARRIRQSGSIMRALATECFG